MPMIMPFVLYFQEMSVLFVELKTKTKNNYFK